MSVRQGTYTPSYRLIYVPLAAGAILSLILLTNSFRDYVFVSRLLATQQVRHRMREYMATLDQQLKRVERRNDSRREPESLGDELATLLEGAQTLSLIEHRTRPFKTARATTVELLTFHGWTGAQLDEIVKRTGGRHVDC
jgi:hypothetical protein